MFRLLIDTNVWIDVAKEPHEFPLIWILEDLLRRKEIELILPRAVVLEIKHRKGETVRQITLRLAVNVTLIIVWIGFHCMTSFKRLAR